MIFITSMSQYAIKGYEVAALDFIVKPITYQLFKIKLDRVIAQIHSEEIYMIKSVNGIRKVRIDKLVYIESSKHYLYFHTETDVFKMRGTMRDIGEEFEKKGFAFLNGSLMVNLSYVEAMNGNEVTAAGNQMAVARAYKIKFKEKLTAFLGGI